MSAVPAGMPGRGFLLVDNTWVEVRRVSVGASVAYARPVVVETTLSGRRRAQVADRPAHRDWDIRLGLADAATVGMWERLVDGVYGVGPFEWVDPHTSATMGPPEEGSTGHAYSRQVIIADMGRTDRLATPDMQISAITLTLTEVGPGGTNG